ncbi:heme o synthase [Magnetospirillum sp. 15-1]|uniref:heme o synthase n=1 Tax=Magnetospirillum sp. 15-1 TaxID=1979370 RepID=UPI000BBC96BF|nr:heme o synthase [Magnetospirillum sp. 15-1]
MTANLKVLASVFKLRIGVFCALAAIAGALVTPGAVPATSQVVAVAVAVLLSAAAAGAFNHYWERDIDPMMNRTRNRPFATGQFAAGPLWPLGLLALTVAAVALAAFVANAWAALHVFLGAFVYGIVYTVWLKRRTAWNIVIGGLSGSFAVLAGAAVAVPTLSPESLILALVLFLWTPPHFWSLATALKDDYAAAGIPMLPVVKPESETNWIILANTVALVASSLLPAFFGAGPLYLGAALLGGLWFLYKSVLLVMRPGRKAAMGNFFASLIQLVLLLTAVMVEPLLAG